MSWITDEQREAYIERGYTCEDCVFRYDCEDDEICLDFIELTRGQVDERTMED